MLYNTIKVTRRINNALHLKVQCTVGADDDITHIQRFIHSNESCGIVIRKAPRVMPHAS